MARLIAPLTDAKVRNAKPRDKEYQMFDGTGLHLLVTPAGSKLWRFKYRINGKDQKISFGKYPEVSLAQARQKRDEARLQLAQGVDPGVMRKTLRLSGCQEIETVEFVAREWHTRFKVSWTADYAERVMGWLEQNIFPWIGQRPVDKIEPPELLSVLRKIETRGTYETEHRVYGICGQFFRYAVATGRAKRDPTPDLRGALPPTQEKHMAAITEPAQIGELLRAIDGYMGSYVVQCALKLQPLLFVRPGELRHMEWKEVSFTDALWSIPADKMKMREPHLVPLSRQAIYVLQDLHKLTNRSQYAMPSARSFTRPMSENAILAALRRMGYNTTTEMSGHGFRAMARTLLDEVLHFRPDYIEHQLAHTVKDVNGRAYNRTTHLDERRKMMQAWADYLDGLKAGAKILPFRLQPG